jgi:hypothetical protein
LFDSVGRQFATRGDRITVKAKQTVSLSAFTPFNFNAASLGSRLGLLLGAFLRMRFVKITARFDIVGTSTSSGAEIAYAGFLDDYAGEGGGVTIPSTNQGVVSLRCSAAIATDAPTMLQWDPVDKTKWYYVQQGASGNDLRFTNQVTLIAGTAPASMASVIATLYYVIEAEGAISDTGV